MTASANVRLQGRQMIQAGISGFCHDMEKLVALFELGPIRWNYLVVVLLPGRSTTLKQQFKIVINPPNEYWEELSIWVVGFVVFMEMIVASTGSERARARRLIPVIYAFYHSGSTSGLCDVVPTQAEEDEFIDTYRKDGRWKRYLDAGLNRENARLKFTPEQANFLRLSGKWTHWSAEMLPPELLMEIEVGMKARLEKAAAGVKGLLKEEGRVPYDS